MKKKPQANDIDKYAGARLRELRLELGLSQTALADAIGVSFQQIQKYENGTNRMAAGRLWDIAAAFDLPITTFFPDKG